MSATLSSTPSLPPTKRHLAALARELKGPLVQPGNTGWDNVRRAWNLTVDQHPAAVVVASSAQDVAAVVRHARDTGWRVAMQTTGHGAATLDLRDVILIRTGELRGVRIDAAARRIHVAAGEPVGAVVSAAARHGLAFLAGTSPDVGVTGYTLGGGIGWLSRRYGLACNSLRSAEVVTADGVVRTIDLDRESELFWALRGGGGAFAAVTALDAELVPVARVDAGALSWPLDRAEQVLRRWAAWTAEVPDSITSIVRLLRYPPLSTLPAAIRGRSFVKVEVVCCQPGELEGHLRALRELAPAVDTVAPMTTVEMGALHGDPADPVPAMTDHRLLRELTDGTVDAVLELAGPDATIPLLAFDLRHLGGRMNVSSPEHGVLDRLDAGYAAFGVAVAVDPDTSAILDTFAAMRTRLAPWDRGTEYLNFADRPVDTRRLFEAGSFDRLAATKATYDPEDRFVSNHPVAASA